MERRHAHEICLEVSQAGYISAITQCITALLLPVTTRSASHSETETDEPAALLNSLANHVPSIESLKPGVLEVIEGSETKKWFGE